MNEHWISARSLELAVGAVTAVQLAACALLAWKPRELEASVPRGIAGGLWRAWSAEARSWGAPAAPAPSGLQGLLADISRGSYLLKASRPWAWAFLFFAVMLKLYAACWSLRPPVSWRLLVLVLAGDWALFFALLRSPGRAAFAALFLRVLQMLGFIDALFAGDFVQGGRLHRMCPGGRIETIPAPIPEELTDPGWLARSIAKAAGTSEAEAARLLRSEEAWPSSGALRKMRLRGVPPYVWTEKLREFYKDSGAFFYELVVWNRSRFKRGMRKWISFFLRREEGAPALRVLCYGDGMGFDSLCLARLGHDVVYEELSAPFCAYARSLFSEAGARVDVVEGDSALAPESFDAIVCLDVLEHVPDPAALVERFALWLKPGGRLVVHALFGSVNRYVATHLEANRRHWGGLELYARCGLRLVAGNWPCWNPIVLQKAPWTQAEDSSALLRLSGCAMRWGLYAPFFGFWAGWAGRALNWLGLKVLRVSLFNSLEASPFP